jgi:hypothetical protein
MNTVEVIIKFLPFVGFLTFLKVVWEYNRGQKWKRSEFLSKEIKEFVNDSSSKIVFQLLDWNVREFNINGEEIVINDSTLANALATHEQRQRFDTWEADIRDIFDKFFDRISTFQIYIKSGLIREKELYYYIGYYIKILDNKDRKPQILIDAFDNYLTYYDFKNVKELMKSFKKYR